MKSPFQNIAVIQENSLEISEEYVGLITYYARKEGVTVLLRSALRAPYDVVSYEAAMLIFSASPCNKIEYLLLIFIFLF